MSSHFENVKEILKKLNEIKDFESEMILNQELDGYLSAVKVNLEKLKAVNCYSHSKDIKDCEDALKLGEQA